VGNDAEFVVNNLRPDTNRCAGCGRYAAEEVEESNEDS